MLHVKFEQSVFFVRKVGGNGGFLMQMKFLKYCIIRSDDNMCYPFFLLLLHSLESIFIAGYLWGHENVNFNCCLLLDEQQERCVVFN